MTATLRYVRPPRREELDQLDQYLGHLWPEIDEPGADELVLRLRVLAGSEAEAHGYVDRLLNIGRGDWLESWELRVEVERGPGPRSV